jgi:YD repeat-containing protein
MAVLAQQSSESRQNMPPMPDVLEGKGYRFSSRARHVRIRAWRCSAHSASLRLRFDAEALPVDARNATNLVGYLQGLVVSVTNALQQTNGFAYDFGGRRLTTSFADATSVTYRYKLLGQLTNTADAASVSTTNSFNNQGLLSTFFTRMVLCWLTRQLR